jgi:hypothetical protein
VACWRANAPSRTHELHWDVRSCGANAASRLAAGFGSTPGACGGDVVKVRVSPIATASMASEESHGKPAVFDFPVRLRAASAACARDAGEGNDPSGAVALFGLLPLPMDATFTSDRVSREGPSYIVTTSDAKLHWLHV